MITRYTKVGELAGLAVSSVEVDRENGRVLLTLPDGEFTLTHWNDHPIEGVCGELSQLAGSTVLTCVEVMSVRLTTDKGCYTVHWKPEK